MHPPSLMPPNLFAATCVCGGDLCQIMHGILTCHYASKMTPACLHSMPTCTCLSSMPCQHMGCFLTLHLKFKHPFITCKHTICMSTCQNARTNSQRFFITYLHTSMWRLSLLGTIFFMRWTAAQKDITLKMLLPTSWIKTATQLHLQRR